MDKIKLINLINRTTSPAPWSEGDNIPWNDPEFSERMLKEHLTQEHNAASRKSERIDQHVEWIHNHIFEQKPSKILDLACGPGLYSNRLAALGHQCVGIDYSPASIAYAKETAKEQNPFTCSFIEADIRQAEYGENFDAALLIYGELNVFKLADAQSILKKTHSALKSGGLLILEPHTFQAVQTWGERAPAWFTSDGGLFHDQPHLVLFEYFWDADALVTTQRYFIIDGNDGSMIRYAQSVLAYTNEQYQSLLESCGFTNIRFYPSLMGNPDPDQKELLAIKTEKP